jgi:RHS repeat-associated protein
LLLLVFGQAEAILAQNGPPSKDRYIIVLKPPKNGVPELSDHVITAGGGKVEYKVPGLIQVTLPEPAVEAMRKQERVKYIQRVILGPLPNASAPATLRMTPSTSSLRATTESTPPTWRSGTYKYDASGNIYAIGVANDETGSTVQHRYAYDELSRLKRADTITTSTHTETFTYDEYGNLTEHVDGSSVTSTPVEDPNTNRLAWSTSHPYTYDAAGNLTADYNAAYFYDPFSMLREKDYGSKQEFYVYTASDERIGVKYGTANDSPTIWSIRDFSGNVLRQYESHDQVPQMAWLWKEDYVYRDGQLLAAERVPEEGGRRHFHLDHLGSPRLVTGQDSKEMSEHDFEPFGLESNPQWQETSGGFDREDPKRFTGHERDYAAPPGAPASTAYLDYMHARFYGPNVSRFLSIDPFISKESVSHPQMWNRYAYGLNNPVLNADPTGRDVSIGVRFSGDGWTDDQKRRLLAYVRTWYASKDIGHVYVFDSAKQTHGRFFGSLLKGHANIEVSMGTGRAHEPGRVFAGSIFSDKTLTGRQQIQTIANAIVHETAAHQFHGTYVEENDSLFYLRDTFAAQQDPGLPARYGTVADSYAFVFPDTKPNVTDGPIPIYSKDLRTLQGKLRPAHAEPPKDRE